MSLPSVRASILRAILVAGLALVAPGATSAQDATMAPARRDRLVSVFSGMSAKQGVQVITPGRVFEDVTFLSLGAGQVQISDAGATVGVDLGDIRGVAVERGHGLKGALWGFSAGFLVGSVSGMMINSFSCQTVEGCNSSESDGALWGGLGVGAAGATLGFVIGHRSIYWYPVFP